MIKLNKKILADKIHACWIGKNIGGTMGAPYEGKTHMNDIHGFITPKGEPVANDDLDLQLVWLMAMEVHGPYQLNSHVLGEHWLRCIPPHWNEYGICKANMEYGLLPPLSGEYENRWKHSNGAWIRSEIWACMAPGFPDIAIRYAIEDAMVDHGMGEGSYAELFTVAMDSAAFVMNDIRELINIGLSKIPESCRIARSVNLVMDSYDNHLDWKETRKLLVEDCSDLGWFQAPANIGFVVLGLLYGEGDFKKSMIYAINCGDDTDCTGATIGALLGIINGTAGIPSDWSEYIGEKIVTISLNKAAFLYSRPGCPNDCSELTNRIIKIIPAVLTANQVNMEFTDENSQYEAGHLEMLKNREYAETLYNRSGYSYDIDLMYAIARVEFGDNPDIKPFESKKVTITYYNQTQQSQNMNFRFILPDGWNIEAKHMIMLESRGAKPEMCTKWNALITAGEITVHINRVIIEVSSHSHLVTGYIPIIFMG
ncbi:MAG: ADP-ribosylglycohydrolase family protein [Clostridia bacterium]|nr:ADP-ribosylglycohydrolase family protein [Clostridia bacterium]